MNVISRSSIARVIEVSLFSGIPFRTEVPDPFSLLIPFRAD